MEQIMKIGTCVKWNLYDSGTDYGTGGKTYKLYAYQTLWGRYDAFKGNGDTVYSQAYRLINFRVKWNLYDSGTDYGTGGKTYKLYAYQTLWGRYDAYKGNGDTVYSQAYRLINFRDEWRRLPRTMVLVSIGTGTGAFAVLVVAVLMSVLKKKDMFVIFCWIISSLLATISGFCLAYAMNKYSTHYRSMLDPTFYEPKAFYPDEDNLSSGFFMALMACSFFFISSMVDIINIVVFIKTIHSEGRLTVSKVKPKSEIIGNEVVEMNINAITDIV
ncbi:Hypothetical predicted protein [Mytilus galloprovincialis]|uniref:Uncharacterized protein n=1 Tax=Mytilus galloprovincialis TaxID=29158 RepID=A0A8B6F6P0_MYTGA|nr:Hypothetical predicted protein [Mytilus galloprovincialis]